MARGILGSKDIDFQMFEIGEAMAGNDIHHNIVAAAYARYGNTVELNPAFVTPGTRHDNVYRNPGGGAVRFSYGDSAIVAGDILLEPPWSVRCGPRTKDRRADADMGGTTGHRHLKIPTHPD